MPHRLSALRSLPLDLGESLSARLPPTLCTWLKAMVSAGHEGGRQATGGFLLCIFNSGEKWDFLNSEQKHFYWEITLLLTLK